MSVCIGRLFCLGCLDSCDSLDKFICWFCLLGFLNLWVVAVNMMDEVGRKEVGFYVVCGCALLCVVVAVLLRSLWYAVVAVAFMGFAWYAWSNWKKVEGVLE